MTRFLRLGVPLLVVVAAAAFAVGSAQGAKPPSPPPGQAPKLTFTPASATFGPVEPGVGASQDFVLSFRNGTTSGGLTVTVAGDEAFGITADTCTGTAISTSRTCTVTVTYTATGYSQSSQGTLTAAGKKDVKPASALLSGSSTEEPAEPLVTATPDIIDFGNQIVGDFTYDSQAILFTNTSTSATVYLQGTGVAPTGFNATSTSWSICNYGLAPGQSCWGNIKFHPTAAGPYTGSYTTTWTDSRTGGTTLATTSTTLRGIGILDVIQTSVTELAFGSINPGTTKTLGIKFTNTSDTLTLQIASTTMEEGYPIFKDNFTTGSTCFTSSGVVALAPNDFCTISITFSPPADMTETTSYEGLFRTGWRAPNSGEEVPNIAVTSTELSGTGTVATGLPTLSINDPTIAYGTNIIFTVTMNHTSTTPVTFNWATAAGTAVSGTTCIGNPAPNDYVGGSGTKTIAAGSLSTTISIETCGAGPGSWAATDTNFTVTISTPSGATITDGTGTGTLFAS